jgi:hypothetical protein
MQIKQQEELSAMKKSQEKNIWQKARGTRRPY